ncbi:MAG: hypothetical protein GX879_00310, partial [Bacteroidales bacterium]|nr:hypothetical protein [Bacteroidales bacterium]
MRKIILLLLALPLLLASVKADNKSISEALVKGRWVNKQDGYIPKPIMPREGEKVKTVKRLKAFEFHDDGSFIMDSAKQTYQGYWKLKNDSIFLTYVPVATVRFGINLEPGANTGDYAYTKDTVNLCPR